MQTVTVLYLDNNSTTAVLPAVVEAMQPFWHHSYANPASQHQGGRHARRAVEDARCRIADILDAQPAEVIFTSGATEANNLALGSFVAATSGPVWTTPLEHPSVLEPLRVWTKRNKREIAWLRVDKYGLVREIPLSAGIGAGLYALQWSNHETGAVQPIAELHKQVGIIPWHCDATQAVGRIPVSFHRSGVTSLSFSAHKFHGPRGIGGLIVREGVRLHPSLLGGGQQAGMRPGTEPVPLIAGMAKALELACAEMTARTEHLTKLRHLLLTQLQAQAQPVFLNGPASGGVPHTLNLSFPGCDAATLLMKLDLAGVLCSVGAACASGSLQPSPVLQAMGLPTERVRSALRFSLSHLLTEADILEAAVRIRAAVAALRQHASE